MACNCGGGKKFSQLKATPVTRAVTPVAVAPVKRGDTPGVIKATPVNVSVTIPR